MQEDRPLTSADAAAELGWSVRTLNRRREAGHIRAWVKLPGHSGAWLFTRAEIVRVKKQLAEDQAAAEAA